MNKLRIGFCKKWGKEGHDFHISFGDESRNMAMSIDLIEDPDGAYTEFELNEAILSHMLYVLTGKLPGDEKVGISHE